MTVNECRVLMFAVMTVTALSSYAASGSDEVSYLEGERLEVLNISHTGWWTVRYVSVLTKTWHHVLLGVMLTDVLV